MPIFAISGGSLADGETLGLDRFNVELTGKERPRVLFVPTASSDSPGYCRTFREIYGGRLGCEVDTLLLGSVDRETAVIEDKLGAADLVYVGGGSTLRMMTLWRRLGVDRLLRQAGPEKVLSGLSAGAICWHQFGHSDSRKTVHSDYIRVRALGLVPGLYCPHYDSEHREADFGTKLRSGELGWACDDLTAVWYPHDGTPQVLSLRPGAAVRLFCRTGAEVQTAVYGHGDRVEAEGASGPPKRVAVG